MLEAGMPLASTKFDGSVKLLAHLGLLRKNLVSPFDQLNQDGRIGEARVLFRKIGVQDSTSH